MRAILSLVVLAAGVSLSQTGSNGAARVVMNPSEASWTHDKGDPPGSDGVVLRMDSQSGGLELFARYPAGYEFPVHWHDSNERMILMEGRLSIEEAGATRYLEPGGYAFLPARQVQKLKCVSTARCVFYVAWDGKPASHKPPVK